MEKDWLQKKITLEEVEKTYLVCDERLGDNPVPFGFKNNNWINIKESLEEKDEIYIFSSPEESWDFMAGRAGICIVRDGVIIKWLITEMS